MRSRLGDPFYTATEQGPQVDKTQFDKVLGYIEAGKHEGARCVTGGERFGSKGYFIKPTIFADVKDNMKIATEEIFGPVMQVLKFKDVDEVVKRANTTDYGLAAAIWSRDIKKAHTIAERLRAGTVWINCYDVFDAAAPFGRIQSQWDRPRARREIANRQLHRAQDRDRRAGLTLRCVRGRANVRPRQIGRRLALQSSPVPVSQPQALRSSRSRWPLPESCAYARLSRRIGCVHVTKARNTSGRLDCAPAESSSQNR